jgi:DNA repair photolyase
MNIELRVKTTALKVLGKWPLNVDGLRLAGAALLNVRAADKAFLKANGVRIRPEDLSGKIDPAELVLLLRGGTYTCSWIYAPRGQAAEYSPLATNPYHGCGHGCIYCYVPGVLHMPRPEFDAGAVLRDGYLENLAKDARRYLAAGDRRQVMLSFTTDPYHPGDSTATRSALQILAEHGMGFCTLTKGGSRALRDIDLFRPDRDAFAATLTTLDEAFSRKWERGAALPADRIATLRKFHDAGIYTWASLEPTLDVEASLAIVDATHPFVDLYKVGRANYLAGITRTTDWADYTRRMVAKLQNLGKAHYIKRDLQSYLEPGYCNPLRVEQIRSASNGAD